MKTKRNSIVMLLSNPAAEGLVQQIFLIYGGRHFRGFESRYDKFSSPERSLPAGIEAGCDTFLSESIVERHPEAKNLYLTRNRQTSPAVEKCLRNNT